MVANRWPDFFILGAPRCGTTFLYGALRIQPAVFMPKRKEPKFFAGDLDTGSPSEGGMRIRDEARYRELFEPALPDQLIGEASSNYLVSAVAVPRILDVQPDARFVVSLRDPVHQIASHHALLRADGVEQLDLESALRVEEERIAWPAPTRVPALGGAPRYRPMARYGEQLQRLFSVASRAQIVVVTLDDIEAQPLATVTRVARFLGIPDPTTLGEPDRNASRAPRSRRLLEAVWSPASIAVAKSVVPRRLHPAASRLTMLAHAWNRREGPRPAVPAALEAQLRDELRPDLELASRLLEQDLIQRWWGASPSG